MSEATDNSSLPLLLSITGAVVAVAVGGWFLLNQESFRPDAGLDIPIDVPASSTAETAEPDDDKLDVDSELRKARLAADAEILVLPATQSALFYYGRVLHIDPQHAIAIAELDAILAKESQVVTRHLAAQEYDDAYKIAVLVARLEPEHALVIETQTTLDALTEELVHQSINSAQKGNDKQSDQLLATARALPGGNPNYFSAISDSIAEVRTVREAAARDRAQRAQLAADDARAAWVERTQAAIAAGNLIAPAGASAKDLLAEPNSWTTERARLTGDLLTALLVTAEIVTEDKQFGFAENLLNTATELEGDPNEIEAIRAALETALIEEKSNRMVPVSELVIVKTASPRYPRRAQDHNITGWVEVYFTVTPSGKTTDIEITSAEPETTFDRAAISAVGQWTFEPVEYRGQIISQRAATRLVFKLK